MANVLIATFIVGISMYYAKVLADTIEEIHFDEKLNCKDSIAYIFGKSVKNFFTKNPLPNLKKSFKDFKEGLK